ncbi:COP1-interactive protein 1-like [Aristolochia californica]|uniref:COP1-interactive protein 1-like n=1 Tax=Aristolochia californica TaxID=171875 RepID=UPI0035DE08A9
MKKHRLRGFLASILVDHVNSDDSVWLEEHKKAIESNMKKILNLLNEEKEGGSDERSEIGPLIEDFYEYYKVLHERYNNLTEELKTRVDSRGKTDGSSSSSSSSDSDSEEGKNRKTKAGKRNSSSPEFQSLEAENKNMKQDLEALGKKEADLLSNLQDADKIMEGLRSEVQLLKAEIEDLNLERSVSLNKAQELEKTLEEFKADMKLLKDHNTQLIGKVDDLKVILSTTKAEKDALTSENLAAQSKLKEVEKIIEELRDEIKRLDVNKEETQKIVQELKGEMERLNLENSKLQAENSDVKHELEKAHQDLIDLNKIIQGAEEHKAKLMSENTELLERLELSNKNFGEQETEIKRLTALTSILQQQETNLQDQVLDLEKRLEEGGQKSTSLSKELEDVKMEASAKVDDLTSEIEELQLKLDMLSSQKKELEEQMESEKNETSDKLFQHENLKLQLLGQISSLERSCKESTNFVIQLNENHKQVESDLQESYDKLGKAELKIREMEEENILLRKQMDEMTLEMGVFHAHNMKLEQQLEKMKSEASELQILKEKLNQSNENHKKVESNLQESHEKLGKAEQKIGEVEEENIFLRKQVNEMTHAMDSLRAQNNVLEEQLERVRREASDLLILKEKLNQLTDKHNQVQSDLQESHDKLVKSEQKLGKIEEENMLFRKQVDDITLEKDTLRAQIMVLEEQLGTMGSEVSELQFLKEELNQLTINHKQVEFDLLVSQGKLEKAEQRIGEMEEENMALRKQVDNLTLEMDSLRALNTDLIESHGKLEEAERRIEVMEEENVSLRKQVNEMTLEMGSLHAQTMGLGEQLERVRSEASELQIQRESTDQELDIVKSNHENMLKEHEEYSNNLIAELNQTKKQLTESSNQVMIVELKIAEMASEIQSLELVIDKQRKEIEESADNIRNLKLDINVLEERHKEILGLKDEKIGMMQKIEGEQKEEIAKLSEIAQNIEVQLRLSNQKLKITESEFEKKEEKYRKQEMQLHEGHRLLDDQIMKLSQKVSLLENERNQIGQMTKTALQAVRVGVDNLEVTVQKFEENHAHVDARLSNYIIELDIMRTWVSGTTSEKLGLKAKIQSLAKRLKDAEEVATLLQGKLEVSEKKAINWEKDKQKLMETVAVYQKKTGELENRVKEKEEEMVNRNEEKREAIRQLCFWMEYRREENDRLRETLLALLKRTK